MLNSIFRKNQNLKYDFTQPNYILKSSTEFNYQDIPNKDYYWGSLNLKQKQKKNLLLRIVTYDRWFKNQSIKNNTMSNNITIYISMNLL